MAAGRNMRTAAVALIFLVAAVCRADLNKDREECTDQLVGLATCLPYVGGDSKAPTIDCCSGLKEVLDKSRKCICVLIRDRDDPNLGLKVNGTLAIGLPDACHAPTNITECIDLLHISPNSTEAKIFEVSSSTTNTSSTAKVPIASEKANSTSSGSTSANSVSYGARINKGLGLEILCAALLWFFAPIFVLV